MSLRAPVLAAVALCLGVPALLAIPNKFLQTNLVSDIPGLAVTTDPNLVNPWGISFGATSPFWVSNQGTGTSTLYNGAGAKIPLTVSMPAIGAPITGQVFAGGSGGFNGDAFLFASLSGTISGWRGALGATAEVLSSTPGAVFTGLALGITGGNAYAYASDFANNSISILKGVAAAPDLTGAFVDPALPAGYSPFNIQNLGGKLYVTYAVKDPVTGRDVPGAGNGIVSVFDLNGNFLNRLTSGGALNSPWGVALAPSGFGPFGGDLLVGNFGDGTISAYDPTTGAYVDTLRNQLGNPLSIEGLWGITFGNGGAGGDKNKLYFAAGIDEETHGLFGSLTSVPDSGSSLALLGGGMLALLGCHRLRSKRAGIVT